MDFKKGTEESIGWFVLENKIDDILKDNNKLSFKTISL